MSIPSSTRPTRTANSPSPGVNLAGEGGLLGRGWGVTTATPGSRAPAGRYAKARRCAPPPSRSVRRAGLCGGRSSRPPNRNQGRCEAGTRRVISGDGGARSCLRLSPARGGPTGLPALRRAAQTAGYCARPVRLRGTVAVCDGHDGARREVWTTRDEPDGVLRKACGNRREAVCAAVRGALPRRRLPPDRRGPARRQGRAGHDHRASRGVRHADGAELRARAHPPARPGRTAAALPPPA